MKTDPTYEQAAKSKGQHCEVCGKFVEGFEYQKCCNSFDCGCGGKSIYPCICSEECYKNFGKDEEKEWDGKDDLPF